MEYSSRAKTRKVPFQSIKAIVLYLDEFLLWCELVGYNLNIHRILKRLLPGTLLDYTLEPFFGAELELEPVGMRLELGLVGMHLELGN